LFHFGIFQDDEAEMQKLALEILKNLCNDVRVGVKVSRFLPKYLQFFMGESAVKEELLQLLTALATFEDNTRIMQENGFIKEVIKMVKDSSSRAACESLAVLSKNIICLEEIFGSENIFAILLQSLNDSNGIALLSTFHSLINLQGLAHLLEISSTLAHTCAKILRNPSPPLLQLKVIGILEKLATYSQLKSSITQSSELSKEVFFCLLNSSHSTKLIARLFHLIANYIDQQSFRSTFIEFNASMIILIYLPSQVSQVRSSVCTLINLASNYAELAANLIDNGVLSALIRCDFECSICCDGFESLLSTDMSLKFSIRRRLEASDKIATGFYATKCSKLDWSVLREVMRTDLQSPLHVIYTVNFGDECVAVECRKIQRGANLVALKRSLCNDEFVSAEKEQKVKMLAVKIAHFLQTDDVSCTKHHFATHLCELKFKFASSVIPIGSLIYGGSFEAALLFKALSDQLNLQVSFVTDADGKSWNQVGDGIVDLFFDIGAVYEASSRAGRIYLQNIS
jgi:hypothetical protein